MARKGNMRTIYKFQIKPSREIEIEMPKGAEFLSCAEQFESPDASFQAWFMVDKSAENELRRFRVVGTGHPIEGPGYRYLGTAVAMSGDLVWHLFDMGPSLNTGSEAAK